VPVADRHIVSAFETIEAIREDTALTYFEFNTLAALIIFDNATLDIVLLEVGLGGRLDATNIIDPDVAVLTSIDLDHQQWLGETRSEIAAEKLGIARAGRPLIIGETDYPENFQHMVNDTKANALWCGKEFDYQLEQTSFSATLSRCETGNSAAWQIDNLHAEGLLPINKLLALQALVSAGFVLQADKCRSALQNINLNGRQQEFIYRGVRVILDVAHNPAAAAVLRHSLEQEKGRSIAVVSVLEDKDWDSILAALSPVIAEWKLAQLQSVARAAEGQSLLKLLYNRGLHGTLYSSVKEAFQAALSEAGSDDKIVVFGSFHTVAVVLAIILTEVSSE
jgi:dihydrofolate synthase/folylpolyglutamate synthase